jgi:hypothetical protein
MANPNKGEVDVEIKGQQYRLAFTTNSICELEDLLGRGWFDIANDLASWSPPTHADGSPRVESADEIKRRIGRIRFSLMRSIFWAMLRENHADVTIKKAGELMQAAGDTGGALTLINRVFERSMPDARGSGGGDQGDPPTPGAAQNADGIGRHSADRGVN